MGEILGGLIIIILVVAILCTFWGLIKRPSLMGMLLVQLHTILMMHSDGNSEFLPAVREDNKIDTRTMI